MKRTSPGTAPSPEEQVLLRPESRAKLISMLVRYLQEEDRVEARTRQNRDVRR